MKKIIIGVVVVLLVVVGGYFFMKSSSEDTNVTGDNLDNNAQMEDGTIQEGDVVENVNLGETTIGTSVEGRKITAYHYGTGTDEVLFVGGIHGGYEWNTVLVAYELIDYLDANPSIVPANLKVTVIPVVNPDGLFKTVGKEGRFTSTDVPQAEGATVSGRFNSNTVDLNRNFDCDWQANGKWQDKDVSGGASAFSEPESQAIKSYVEKTNPEAVVVWYSAAGGVFASNCHNGVSPETTALTNTFAKASGYPAYESFNFYEITGDMVNWLAKINVPAISVLLTNHTSTEWTKNKAGVEAILSYLAE